MFLSKLLINFMLTPSGKNPCLVRFGSSRKSRIISGVILSMSVLQGRCLSLLFISMPKRAKKTRHYCGRNREDIHGQHRAGLVGFRDKTLFLPHDQVHFDLTHLIMHSFINSKISLITVKIHSTHPLYP